MNNNTTLELPVHGKSRHVDFTYLSILTVLILAKVLLFLYQGESTNWITVGFFFIWKVSQFSFFFYVVTPRVLARVKNEKYLNIILYNYVWTLIFTGVDMAIFRNRVLDFPEEFYQLTTYFQIGFFLVINLILFHISSVTFLRLFNEAISLNAMRIENAKKQLEIINNQQQIGPHYLSNTLNNLQRLIRDKDFERAAIYNSAVHHLFTTQVGFVTKDVITLEEEMSWLNSFIQIEEERLGSPIKLDIHYSNEELILEKIPVLLLQPIIENSVVHGFTSLSNKVWNIQIHITEIDEHTIDISIKDNGVGSASKQTKRKQGGVGIANIKRRIQLINEIGKMRIKFNQTIDQHGAQTNFTIRSLHN